jgi:hypothetical protein
MKLSEPLINLIESIILKSLLPCAWLAANFFFLMKKSNKKNQGCSQMAKI